MVTRISSCTEGKGFNWSSKAFFPFTCFGQAVSAQFFSQHQNCAYSVNVEDKHKAIWEKQVETLRNRQILC